MKTNTEAIAGVLFNKERSSVLLILRRDVPVWVLPGGGVESGECPQEAIIREILEETGLTVKANRLVGIYTPINRLARRTKLYECTFVKGELTISDETKGVAFFPLDELPPMPPPYPEWIEDAKEMGPIKLRPLASVTYAALGRNFIRHPLLVLRFLLSRVGLSINSR